MLWQREIYFELAPYILMGWNDIRNQINISWWPREASEFAYVLEDKFKKYRENGHLLMRACLAIRFPEYFNYNPNTTDHFENRSEDGASDYAMTGKKMINTSSYGGIDLNARNLNLRIKQNNRVLPSTLNQQDMVDMPIDGLSPVILKISPVSSSNIFSNS